MIGLYNSINLGGQKHGEYYIFLYTILTALLIFNKYIKWLVKSLIALC
jgi:hypothetical protein